MWQYPCVPEVKMGQGEVRAGSALQASTLGQAPTVPCHLTDPPYAHHPFNRIPTGLLTRAPSIIPTNGPGRTPNRMISTTSGSSVATSLLLRRGRVVHSAGTLPRSTR